MDKKPKIIVFASGEKEPGKGGSGFKNLAEASRDGRLSADIIAAVSNHAKGGVHDKAKELGIPFVHFPKSERTPECHQALVRELGGEGVVFVALSGCLWLVPMKESPEDPNPGLDPRYVFNIHPGPLPKFGGDGMYGDYVHEAVMQAYNRGEVTHSAATMHFATKKYDEGPIFFHYPVRILPSDDAQSMGQWVNAHEHRFQPYITDLVVNGKIHWDGKDTKTLTVPDDYKFLPPSR